MNNIKAQPPSSFIFYFPKKVVSGLSNLKEKIKTLVRDIFDYFLNLREPKAILITHHIKEEIIGETEEPGLYAVIRCQDQKCRNYKKLVATNAQVKNWPNSVGFFDCCRWYTCKHNQVSEVQLLIINNTKKLNITNSTDVENPISQTYHNSNNRPMYLQLDSKQSRNFTSLNII